MMTKVNGFDRDKVEEEIDRIKKEGTREVASSLGAQTELFYTISGQIRFIERTFARLKEKYESDMRVVKFLRENLDRILDKNLTLPDGITQEIVKAINDIDVAKMDKAGGRVKDYLNAMAKEES